MKKYLTKISAVVLACALFFPLGSQAFTGPYSLYVQEFEYPEVEPEATGSVNINAKVFDSAGIYVGNLYDTNSVNSGWFDSPATHWKMALPNFIDYWESNNPGMTISNIVSPYIMPTGTTTEYIRGDGTFATFPTRSQASSTRSLNSAFQVSTTRDSFVNYSVDIATSVSISGGEVGTVHLEIADDSGFTTNVQQIGRESSGSTGTFVLGLAIDQTGTASLSGFVPAGKYVRIRTADTTGTPTFTYQVGQEVLM